MSRIVVIRHAPTSWNREKRLQGRTDIQLDEEGVAIAARWRVPAEWQDYLLLVSPMARARATALILFPDSRQKIEQSLIEMHFGEWEGKTLAELRDQPGADARERESLGLDFRAPNGESPREVQVRLQPLLDQLAAYGRPAVLVTHKAVLRALYALATGWQMLDKPPHKLRDGCAQLFDLGTDGLPRLEQVNYPLSASE